MRHAGSICSTCKQRPRMTESSNTFFHLCFCPWFAASSFPLLYYTIFFTLKERKKQNKQTHQRALTHDVCGFSCSSRAGAFQMCAVPSRAQLPLAPADGWQLSKNAELFWMFILTSFPCAQMVCLRPFEQEVVGSSWLLIPAGARSQLWIEHCLLLTLSLGRDHWRNHWDWWL